MNAQITSGTTAKATVSDTAVAVLSSTPGTNRVFEVTLINDNAVAGFYTLNGGDSVPIWARLPAGPCAITLDLRGATVDLDLRVKRVASGTDLGGVWASALIRPA